MPLVWIRRVKQTVSHTWVKLRVFSQIQGHLSLELGTSLSKLLPNSDVVQKRALYIQYIPYIFSVGLVLKKIQRDERGGLWGVNALTKNKVQNATQLKAWTGMNIF